MRAISLYQPWASLWLSTRKVHETRHWETAYRGPLAVHATQRLVSDVGLDLDEVCIDEFGPHWRTELPRGAIIGFLELIACTPTKQLASTDRTDLICGDFGPGRFGWKRGAFRLLSEPIPYKGRQGFFPVPEHLVSSNA